MAIHGDLAEKLDAPAELLGRGEADGEEHLRRDRAKVEGDDERIIELPLPNRTMTFTARDFVFGFSLPNFYFHYTTAYDLLRHNGVPLGKRDYIGAA